MVELVPEPKKHLAFDTDWASALVAAGGLVILAFLGAGTIWMTLRGTLPVPKVGWSTPLLAAFIIYCAIVVPDKFLKTVCYVLAVGPISRMLLWVLRASPETQLMNAIFTRWIDSGLCLGICAYILFWFKAKVTHV